MPRKKREDAEQPEQSIPVPTVLGEPQIDVETASKICQGVVGAKKRAFLLALAQVGNRQRAAKAVGVCVMTTWMWRRDDDNFKRQYQVAMDIAVELMEDEVERRGTQGVLKPVFQGGRLVGSVREYSDTLLIFGLKGIKPDKYRDNMKVEHAGELNIVERLRTARARVQKLHDDKK